MDHHSPYYDLHKFKEEDGGPSVSDIEWTEMTQCSWWSMEKAGLRTVK